MPLPDTRAFTVPADYLNAWCAAQPERDTYDQVALGPPTLGLPALLTWQGMLGWAREALVRLPADQRQYRTFTASVDEQGFRAIQQLIRGFRARLEALAQDAEWLPEERLLAVLIELLPLAGPVVGGEGSRVWRWQKSDFSLPPLELEPIGTTPSTSPGEEPMPRWRARPTSRSGSSCGGCGELDATRSTRTGNWRGGPGCRARPFTTSARACTRRHPARAAVPEGAQAGCALAADGGAFCAVQVVCARDLAVGGAGELPVCAGLGLAGDGRSHHLDCG